MKAIKPKRAILVLEDGKKYYGWSFSEPMISTGEIVFNTGMTGYQEIMTDPSYLGQIVTFTYPEIGNTGINKQDNESIKPYLNGIILKNLSKRPSNWRSHQSFINYLQKYNIIHIYGIDTRALTKYLRKSGTMNGCISTQNLDTDKIYNKLQCLSINKEKDYVKLVSTTEPYKWHKYNKKYLININKIQIKEKDLRIIVIDFGIKLNILRELSLYTKNLIVIPAQTDFTNILKYNPDGILLSNGPGDPEAVLYAKETIQKLLQNRYQIPIFGICMGHQIISLALGLQTFKLKFGHRGLNHPVGLNHNIEITSQNHGFGVESNSLINRIILLLQINLNDKTIAGINYCQQPCFSVQYHPESSPGPHDSKHLFLHFIRIIKIAKKYSNRN
uniref:Carbamoyl phosphate synthase small chain n=1 Tax=Lympha mucosa TaxID=2045360 RepID=A0A6B9VP98_9FLOR|nr:Carbamoyl phosphate synthase small subunit [Lympha mucosa]